MHESSSNSASAADRVWMMKQGLIPRDEALISRVEAAYEAVRFHQRQEINAVLRSMR